MLIGPGGWAVWTVNELSWPLALQMSQPYSPSSLCGKWGWDIYVPNSLWEGFPWLACISILQATVPVRRPSPYSYSLWWASPNSPQSWERKWLPSVASPEDCAIPSCFPYTLPCLRYKPYIKLNSIVTLGHAFCFRLGWDWLTNSGVMQLPESVSSVRAEPLVPAEVALWLLWHFTPCLYVRDLDFIILIPP